MSKTLTVSDETYNLLKRRARQRELETVEQLLDKIANDERESRRETVNGILEFQEKMREKYGVMPDSAELIREDRMR